MIVAVALKEVFSELDLTALSVTAMVIFLVTFVALAVWTALQSREQIRSWSSLPLAEDFVSGTADRVEKL